ncbi:MAG: septal ring lytic transglycosylase RlpA family protein [Flavobacteriaceae bacterium]
MKKIVLVFFMLFSMSILAQTQTGKASFYANKFEGRQTASGEKYSHNKMTAAHRKLPFGTKVKVTNLTNDKSVIVEVNDRGPFIRGRIIDLSRSAAKKLNFLGEGVADVTIQVLDGSADISVNEVTTEEEEIQTPPEKETRPITSTSESHDKTSNDENTSEENHNKEFYKLSVEKIEPDFFGVQIGSFQELANLIGLTDRLKLSYNKDVTVQVKDFKEIKVYTIILGDFKNRLAAERFRDKIDKKYPDAFIVNMTNNE